MSWSGAQLRRKLRASVRVAALSRNRPRTDDVIVVAGSLYLVGAVRPLLTGATDDV